MIRVGVGESSTVKLVILVAVGVGVAGVGSTLASLAGKDGLSMLLASDWFSSGDGVAVGEPVASSPGPPALSIGDWGVGVLGLSGAASSDGVVVTMSAETVMLGVALGAMEVSVPDSSPPGGTLLLSGPGIVVMLLLVCGWPGSPKGSHVGPYRTIKTSNTIVASAKAREGAKRNCPPSFVQS
jgi:hypothetical protein